MAKQNATSRSPGKKVQQRRRWLGVSGGRMDGGRDEGREMKWNEWTKITPSHTQHTQNLKMSQPLLPPERKRRLQVSWTRIAKIALFQTMRCVCVSVMAEIGSSYPSRRLSRYLKVRYTWYVWSRWLYHIFYSVCRHYLVNRWFWTSQSGRRPSFFQDYLKWRTGCGDYHVYDWWILERQVCSTWVGMLLAGLWYETFCGHPVEDHRKLSADHVGRYCR